MAQNDEEIRTLLGDKNLFNSNAIKMYPSSKRSDAFDRNARLTTEQNIISMVNRLTTRDAFVINGMDIVENTDDETTTYAKYILKSGSCNIHGYLFTITADKYISNELITDSNMWLYLTITTKRTTVTANDNTSMTYEELVHADTSSIVGSGNILDNSDNLFTGLNLVVDEIDKTASDVVTNGENYHTYYLPLASIDVLDANIGNFVLNPITWNNLRLNVDDILINAPQNDVANADYAKKQGLFNWLAYNFIIDDGEIN